MSQTMNTNIDPTAESGDQLATDLNNMVAAILSMSSGASRPSYAVKGTTWLDTSGGATANVSKLFDGTNDIALFTLNTTAHAITIPLAVGGTGGNDAASARTSLGLGSLATLSTIGSGQITAGAVNTSALGAGSVTLAKLATDLTNLGKFIRYNSSTGVPEAASPGADITKLVSAFPTRKGASGPCSQFPTFLMQDGSVRVMGFGSAAFGNFDPSSSNVLTPWNIPIKAQGAETISKVVGYGASTYALMASGKVFSGGNNNVGQLGLGDTTNRGALEVIAFFVSNSISIADIYTPNGDNNFGVDGFPVYFLTTSGAVYAAGVNGNGQLGDNTVTNRSTPVQCGTLTGITALSVGGEGAGCHVMAINGSGSLWTWGYNGQGQLGDGTTTDRHVPTSIAGITTASKIAAGGGFGTVYVGYSMVVKSDGSIFGSGYNGVGNLGVGDTTNRSSFSATNLTAGSGVTNIYCMGGNAPATFTLTGSGGVTATGNNATGQLGQGNTTNLSSFTAVSGITVAKLICVSSSYSTATNAVMALLTNNTISAWGYNGYGNLGDGTVTQRTSPTAIPVPSGYATDAPTDICAFGLPNNGFAAYALMTSGRVLATGNVGNSCGNGSRVSGAPSFYFEPVLFL